jgi:hypothetical protein
MDQLERTYGADDTARITDVLIITAVDHNDGAQTTLHFDVSPGMPVDPDGYRIEFIERRQVSRLPR